MSIQLIRREPCDGQRLFSPPNLMAFHSGKLFRGIYEGSLPIQNYLYRHGIDTVKAFEGFEYTNLKWLTIPSSRSRRKLE